MGQQGTYPIGARTLVDTDTLTGVVTGTTADVPLATLSTYMATKAQPGGTSFANFVLNHTTPDRRVTFTDTAPLGWNTVPSRKTVDFEFLSTTFFADNPTNHFAVVTRCDTDVLATDVRGAGAILGDLTWTGFNGDQAKFTPTTIIESWSRPSVALQRYLWPETTGPRNALLADGIRYRWVIETTVQPNTAGVYIRYRLYRQAQPTTKLAWDLLVDTGDVLDAFNTSDMTKQGLTFGIAFPDAATAWQLSVQNLKVTWGPCGEVAPDNSATLSKYGADLQGDLNFIGSSRTVGVTSSGAATTWTKVQSNVANTATSWMILPNGSATISNMLAVNSSNLAGAYQAATYGMSGATALLETFNSGSTDPQLGVNIGAANRVGTFKATGLNILGGSRDIGQLLAFNAGTINWGGANSSNFCLTAAQNMENYCTQYYIRDYLFAVTGFTLTQCDAIEVALRPLYSLFSYVVKDLQNKKVL